MFYEKSVLPNGLTILSEYIDSVRSITMAAWFRVGSRDETPHEAGLSHFMEHMMFKGTPTRDASQISMDFDRLGAELNAFTSKEYTAYYARFVDEHLDAAMDIHSDMLLNSCYEDSCVELEREVVIEEIARSEDTPDDHVYDIFSDAMFPVHPVGRPVLGTRETVGAFTHDDLCSYLAKHYDASNCVIVASGHVDHQELVDLAEKYYSQMPSREKNQRPVQVEENRAPYSFLTKETEQAHVLYGFPGLNNTDPDRYAGSILDAAMGGGMSSRLFQEVREKRGLAYAVYAANQPYQDTGVFAVYAGTRPENLEQVVQIIHQEIDKMVQDGIEPDELERVRELIIGNLVLGMESTKSHMMRLGKQFITDGEMLSMDETIERYRQVSVEDVARVASRIYTQKPTLAVISPFQEEDLESRFSYLFEG